MAHGETVTLPAAVRFPVELLRAEGFDEERVDTWPKVAGRLECVDGRLLYKPPCGDTQQYTVTDVIITLGSWVRSHREYVLGANEAGMRLAGSTRAADAAIWRRRDVGTRTGGLQRTPPVLAVEVAGQDEPEDLLMEKAAWYLNAGVQTVWLVLPEVRQVLVVTALGEQRHNVGDRLPAPAPLADLTPEVGDFFVQIADS